MKQTKITEPNLLKEIERLQALLTDGLCPKYVATVKRVIQATEQMLTELRQLKQVKSRKK